MNTEDFIEELIAQYDSHGAENIVFSLETDSGSGSIEPLDIKFEDGLVKVVFV